MALGGRKLTKAQVIIWSGVILGILDWLSDLVYASTAEFATSGGKRACISFIIMQPLWYVFMFVVYVVSHEEIGLAKERCEKVLLSIPYAGLQWFKLMGSFEQFNEFIYEKFSRRDQFLLFNLENSYRIQIFVELILQTLPQIII
jgi:hypothetical protein